MTGPLERIVVGIDGSDNASQALEWAIALGRQFSSEIVAVHAVGLLSHLADGPPVPSHSNLGELRRIFEENWCQPLVVSGLRHRLLCMDGPPVPVLLVAAERESADMIVVGSRGSGGFAELLLGSTSHQVAEHSPRPVLIIPSGNKGKSGPR